MTHTDCPEREALMQKMLELESSADAETRAWIEQRGAAFLRLMSQYRCAMMEVETKLRVLDVEYSLQHDRNPISAIKTRLKSLPSIRQKLLRRGLPVTLENIEQQIRDVAGVRVICAFPADVYDLAAALLRQDDITLFCKKDYIASPKSGGYRSLHLIVGVPIFLANEKRIMPVEIQLRTIAMDFWASLEHQLRYKKDIDFTPEMAAELLHCAEQSAELDLRMDALRRRVLEPNRTVTTAEEIECKLPNKINKTNETNETENRA